ncbi:biosynthetic-type acetolactate synthase large subunit [bacterium]|nr:biosynthetic-type acetolactate synthase large subunit [bacterium]NIN91680.1 biosynthetic-type acetolactate synthase large subunit [bacterium]NIO18032.1 biosynthetic-type acetolactate synthase large subunit [bacterium]NIO72995.1 biosynthetic-type acetolactate synthase large subunit [bacterium]
MKLTGAQIFVESLIKEKVEIMFGIPGGALLPTFDVLYGAPIKFILARHEQGAAHMADGYARATGKVGVCIATSGPGATNLTTGLATANMDSIPIVAFTGQVATHLVGNDAFQEADTTGVTRSITKYNYLVKDIKELASTIKEAFCIARTGRPGPVLIDLPVDVQRASCEFVYPREVDIRSYKPKYDGHPQQIKKAVEMIKESERPVIYAGGGIIISGASEELREMAKITQIPVTLTLMGMGAFPQDSELFLGMLGMHGTYFANQAIQNSDLIIAIGARFDDRITGRLDGFAPKAKIIHVDIDPTSISKNVKVDIPIVGDAKNVIKEMNKLLSKLGPRNIEKRKKWQKQISAWKKENPLTYKKDDKLRPQYVVEKIYEVTKGKAIITTEVGQNQMWAQQFYKYNYPRHFITSGGLGTMGYGFPAAIGAKLGKPEKIVFDIAGDGSIQMNIQEMATAVNNKVGVKVAILNNGYLGMVRQWQQLFYKKRYSATDLTANPDFVKIAEAYGASGIRVTKKDEAEGALRKAISTDGPVILDFLVEREENVFPMVPAGARLDEVIRGLA